MYIKLRGHCKQLLSVFMINTTNRLFKVEDFEGEVNAASILPLCLKYLCPPAVGYIGLAAVAAAVMSSADSSLLSAASLLTVNTTRKLLEHMKVKISSTADTWILRGTIIILGSIAITMACTFTSIYYLWFFSGDIVYSLLFPPLTASLYRLGCVSL